MRETYGLLLSSGPTRKCKNGSLMHDALLVDAAWAVVMRLHLSSHAMVTIGLTPPLCSWRA